MKRIYPLLHIFLSLVAVSSCKVYDDRDCDSEPAYFVIQASYSNLLYNLFTAGEMTDFFDGYQRIRTDREKAVKYAESYYPFGFDWDECLFYEKAYLPGYGCITLNEDGTYTVSGLNTFSYSLHWSWTGKSSAYEISPLGERRFSVKLKSENETESMAAEIVCDDVSVSVEKLDLEYSGCRIESVNGFPLRRPIVSSGKNVDCIESGKLSYHYDSDGVYDEFLASFDAESVVVERPEKSVRCLSPIRGCFRQTDYIMK